MCTQGCAHSCGQLCWRGLCGDIRWFGFGSGSSKDHPATCQLPSSLSWCPQGHRRPAQLGFPPKNHNFLVLFSVLLVFFSILYQGREEAAQRVVATHRDGSVTSPWGHCVSEGTLWAPLGTEGHTSSTTGRGWEHLEEKCWGRLVPSAGT